jgi:arsenite methyltransferase
MSLLEIQHRYDTLADDNCCLSCGGAINYSKAQAGEVCVDLGSGRGTDVLRLAEQVGMDGHVYGLDISEGMIAKALRNAKKTGIENVSFKKCNLEALPLRKETVDLVISNCTINHANNKQNVWNEIYRILKKGGRFVISDIFSMQPVPGKYKNDPVAVSECWAGAVTREVYMEQLKQAGFSNVTVIEESKPYKKGEVDVSSFTIAGYKKSCCCCG